jgi:hypothetical protein
VADAVERDLNEYLTGWADGDTPPPVEDVPSDIDVGPPPPPVDPNGAERLLRRKKWAERQIAEHRAVAQAELDRINEWLADRIAGPTRIADECDRALDGYARAVHGADLEHGREIKLPSGVLRLTKPMQSIAVVDEKAAAEFLRDNGLPGLKLGVAKSDLKVKAGPPADCVCPPASINDDGDPVGRLDDPACPVHGDRLAFVAATEDGEVVPGIRVEKPARHTFKATPK